MTIIEPFIENGSWPGAQHPAKVRGIAFLTGQNLPVRGHVFRVRGCKNSFHVREDAKANTWVHVARARVVAVSGVEVVEYRELKDGSEISIFTTNRSACAREYVNQNRAALIRFYEGAITERYML